MPKAKAAKRETVKKAKAKPPAHSNGSGTSIVGPGHNSFDQERAAKIRAAVKKLDEFRADAQALSKRRSKYVQTVIKGDLGLKVADFLAFKRLSDLEGDEQNAFISTLREGFNALGKGEMLNFVEVMGQTKAPEGGAPMPGETGDEGDVDELGD